MSQNLQNCQNFIIEGWKAAPHSELGSERPAFLRQPGWVPHTLKNCFMGFASFVIKSNNMKRIILSICLILFVFPLFAQQQGPFRLSVQDCIEMALENNIELKNSQLEIDKARATKNEARAEYFPTVSAQAVAFDALNPTSLYPLCRIWRQYGLGQGIFLRAKRRDAQCDGDRTRLCWGSHP